MRVAILISNTFIKDLGALRFYYRRTLAGNKVKQHQAFKSTNLSDYYLDTAGIGDVRCKLYRLEVQDGLELVRKYTSNSSKILSANWSDPFTFGLALIPPKGGAICWSKLALSTKSRPKPSRMFRNVNYVLENNKRKNFKRTYYDIFDQLKTEKVEETEYFTVYKIEPQSE